MRTIALKCVLVFVLTLPAVAGSAGIVIDYSDDLANDNFFGNNAAAKAALDAAVADINAVLNLNLGAITNDVITGTASDGSMVQFDFDYGYTNPSTGDPVVLTDTTLAANEIRIFAGVQNLTGNTLGRGGPGGAGLRIRTLDFGNLGDAVSDAVASEQHSRGSGPVMSNFTGTSGGEPYSFDVGATIGNLWFDQDTDNMNGTDDAATLNSFWHFDHTTDVEAGKFDFYTVALHETLHAIGEGTSDTWDSFVNGTDWLGAEVIALNGGSGRD